MEKKYNFTYQTKNLVNNKLYIGVHSTNKLDDGYIGCGIHRQSSTNKKLNSPLIKAVRKHGYDNFRLEVLDFFDTKEEAYKEEEYLVDEKWINRRDTYNIKLGGNINSCGTDTALKRGNHPFAKKVINISNGKIYDCAEDVAEILNIPSGRLTKWLSKSLNNPTTFEYLDQSTVKSKNRLRKNNIYVNLKQYDRQGNLIAEFKDNMEARDLLGINMTSLTNHLKGNRSSYLDHIWTCDNIKGGFSNKDLDVCYRIILFDGNKYIKFKNKNEASVYLGYSTNSSTKVFIKLNKGKTIAGHTLVTKEEYLKNEGR